MERRTIVILAGLAAALSVVAIAIVVIAFLAHPPASTSAGTTAAAATAAATTGAAPTADAAAKASPPTAVPSPAPVGAAALAPAPPPAAFRALLQEEPLKTGDPELKFAGSATWSLVDGGPDGQVIEARASIPDRQWSVTVRLRKNNDATFPASHLVEISISGPPGQPAPVGKVVAFRFKTSEEASPEQVTNASQTIIAGLYWVALSDNPKSPKLPSLFRLPWLDILLEYPAGQRAVLSLEKGDAGKRVMEAALASWSALPAH